MSVLSQTESSQHAPQAYLSMMAHDRGGQSDMQTSVHSGIQASMQAGLPAGIQGSTGGAAALQNHNGIASHRTGIMSDTNNDTDLEGDDHMRETEDPREHEDKTDEEGEDSDTNTKRMGGTKARKPHLQGRFSGRLETKADEKRLADECKLLGHLLGGTGKRGEKSRLTLAKIVRGIANGDVRRHCEQREQLLQVSAVTVLCCLSFLFSASSAAILCCLSVLCMLLGCARPLCCLCHQAYWPSNC